MWPLSRVSQFAVLLAVASAPSFVVGAFRILPGFPISVLLLWLSCFFLVLHLISIPRFAMPASGRLVIMLIFLPFLLAFSIGVPAAIGSAPLGLDYTGYPTIALGRVVNAFSLSLFFIGTLALIQKARRSSGGPDFGHQVVWVYWVATGVFATAAIWQISHFYLGIPYPFPETRTHVHGVPAALQGLVPGRLTGLANEPSFLVPFVIDFALLSMLIVRGLRLFLIIAVSIAVVLLSFSAGGYMNLTIISAAWLLLLALRTAFCYRVNVKAAGAVALIGIAAPFFFLTAGPYMELVTARVPGALDPDSHSRAFMVLMPFYWLADSPFLNILFGHGPKSYAMIGEAVVLPASGEPVHVTSNNLFADIVWEHGIVGLSGLGVLFGILALKTRVLFSITRERIVAFLLLVHLFSSSLYRGDFYSLRFLVILLIIVMLIEGLVSGERTTRRFRRGTDVQT